MYRYFGIMVGHLKATVALLHVVGLTAGGHSAAWLGASTPDANRWVQAGIETTANVPGNYLYIEIGRDGGKNDSLWTWPTTPGHVARIRLFHHDTYWLVKVDGHESHRVWIPHGVTVTALEDLSARRMSSLATIDGRLIRGH